MISMSPPKRSRAAALNSWKEIASYLDRGIRTVQRWERDLELPVHRMRGDRGPVFAFPAELDLWLHLSRFNRHAKEIEDGSNPRAHLKRDPVPKALLERSKTLVREMAATAWAQQQQVQSLLGMVKLMSERWGGPRRSRGKSA